jgi:hypothetical protein
VSALACTGEAISWLRLERYALGELPAPAEAQIAGHVAGCPACRGCLDQIRGDHRQLPRLVLPAPTPRRPWWRSRPVWGGAVLAAAAILIFFLVRGGEPRRGAAPGPRVAIKGGGDLVVSIVRERGGEVALDATTYRPGDRFKLRVTCDRAVRVHADVVVFTNDGGGAAAFPLPPARLTCGNQVVVPGAFAITGTAPATVCLAVDPDRPIDRPALRGPGAGMGCRPLAPEPQDRR